MQGFKILTAFCALVSLAAAKNGRISFPKLQNKNVCLNKDDGSFLPVTGSCSKYIICSSGKAFEQDCGAYHFSAEFSVCDLPERVGCVLQGSPTLTSPVPSKPVTEKEKIVPIPTLPPCYAVTNGISLPVPGNQRQYYFCLNNKAFLKDCGNNMYFDVRYSACNVWSDGSDSSFVEKPSFVVTPMVPSNQEKTEIMSVCVGKQNYVSIPVSGNSRQYYFCINNKAFLKDCGSNMIFYPNYSACVLSSEQSFEVVEELDETKTFKEVARKVCANKSFGSRLAFPGSCSLYILCTENDGYVKTCGWRQFSSVTASCDLPQNVRCQTTVEEEKVPQIPATPQPATPKQATPKPAIDTLAKRICLSQKDGTFVAAPGRCSDFYFCLKKQGYAKTCDKDRHFNPKTMTCVNSNESKCVNIFARKSERAILPIDDSSCASKESGTLLSSTTDCGKFIICDNGVAKEMDCPAGLHFNAQDNVCDWPTNAQCA